MGSERVTEIASTSSEIGSAGLCIENVNSVLHADGLTLFERAPCALSVPRCRSRCILSCSPVPRLFWLPVSFASTILIGLWVLS